MTCTICLDLYRWLAGRKLRVERWQAQEIGQTVCPRTRTLWKDMRVFAVQDPLRTPPVREKRGGHGDDRQRRGFRNGSRCELHPVQRAGDAVGWRLQRNAGLAELIECLAAVAHPEGAVHRVEGQTRAAEDSRVETAQERAGVGEMLDHVGPAPLRDPEAAVGRVHGDVTRSREGSGEAEECDRRA